MITTNSRATTRALLAVLVALVVATAGCAIDPAAIGAPSRGEARDAELEALGPVPGVTHWHAAYVVRLCDDVLDGFEAIDDSTGVHSHDDGLIHVHPYDTDSGYENATLGRFLDSVGIELATGEMTLPLGGTWRDGDQCDGVPSRVFVDRWSGPGPTGELERVFIDPQAIRFEADREVYQIAFAPPDSVPVVPPSVDGLDDVSARPQDPGFEVAVPAQADQLTVWPIREVTATPCAPPAVADAPAVGHSVCYVPDGPRVLVGDVVDRAQAAVLNRIPVVAIEPSPAGLAWLYAPTPSKDVRALAIEADEVVIATLRIQWPLGPGDRLVVADGLDAQAAVALADLING